MGKNNRCNKKNIGTILILVFISIICLVFFLIKKDDTADGIGSVYTVDVLEINTEADWIAFSDSTYYGRNYLGKTVHQNTDLDYELIISLARENNKRIVPKEFKGVYNGLGYEINNINIEEREFGGLFSKLQGTVANLVIGNGRIEAPIAGAITGELDNGIIVNCCSYVTIEGETVDGIFGNGDGLIQNCMSYYDEQDLEADDLNERIPVINFINKTAVDSFCLWEDTDDTMPCLTSQFAPDKVVVRFEDGKEQQAYYSKEWLVYVCPVFDNQDIGVDEYSVILKYPDGRQEIVIENTSEESVEFQWGGVEYLLMFMNLGDIPVMNVNLDDDHAYEWMRNTRDIFFAGEVELYNQTGNIEKKVGVREMASRGHHSFTRGIKPGFRMNLSGAVSLLGMPKDEHWVLLPATRDDSFLTYLVNHDMANAINCGEGPKQTPVQLLINHKYVGLYILSERIEIDKNRINLSNGITKDGEPSFIVELFGRDYENEVVKHPLINSTYNRYMVRYPRIIDQDGLDSIANYLKKVENAIDLHGEKDEYGKTWMDYLDVESLAKQFLIADFGEEGSLYSSLYFYRDGSDENNKLFSVRPWDVEHSYKGDSVYVTKAFKFYDLEEGEANDYPYYMIALYDDKDFLHECKKIWDNEMLPAIEASLDDETGYVEGGLSSLSYYLQKYREANELDNSIAPNDMYLRASEIKEYFEVHSEIMSEELKDY